MKSIIAICLIFGLVNFALATVSSNNPGTFLKGPYKVLDDVTNTTVDKLSWAKSGTNYAGVNTRFYPGADNTTIWLSSADLTTSTTVAGVITRRLAVAPLSNGSASTANIDAVSVDGTVATVTYVNAPTSGSVLIGTAGPNYIIATSEPDSTKGYTVLQLYVITAGANTPKGLVTSTTTTTFSNGVTDGTNYAYIPMAIWGEDGNIYVAYEAQVYTKAKGSGNTETITSAIMVQGYNSTGNIFGTAPATVVAAGTLTGPGGAVANLGTASVSNLVAGGNNYTNSTTLLFGFKDIKAATMKSYFYTVVRSSGVSTQYTSLADVGTSGAASSVTYVPAGVLQSVGNGTYGFLVGYTSGATASATYNLSVYLNGSTTLTTTGFTLGTPTGIPLASGFRYTTGYGILAAIPTTSTTTYTYSYNVYYGNGTANTTALASQGSLGSYQSSGTPSVPVSFFLDVNGSAWIGYGTADTTGVQTASIAKIVDNVNAYYPMAGSALVTIAALLSFVIASLFMF